MNRKGTPARSAMARTVANSLTNVGADVIAEGIGHTAIREKVTQLVDARLAELTPRMVKEIVQRMIRQHLGWLVVWGGVFGAVIGLGSSFFV